MTIGGIGAGPSYLYLHGFASGVMSAKAQAFVAWGKGRGIEVDALDLRVPSFSGLRFSAMKERTAAAVGSDAAARAVLIGSSLGGLTACRVAEADARVCAVVAMAPAFRLAETWRGRLEGEKWERWQSEGSIEVDDWAMKKKARVDFGFIEELARLDQGFPDVRVPVLIVHGVRDQVVPVDLSREFARGKRHVRLVEVDDGHELANSIPVVLEETARFLTSFGV